MRRVLIIAPAFPPQGGVGAQRPAKFARYLPEFGWEPAVLAAPIPSSAPIDPPLAEEVAHIPVYRPPLRTIHGITDSSIRWLPSAWAELQRLERGNPYEAIYATGGPFLPFVLPWLLRRSGGPPYILDFRDPWTNNPYTRSATWKQHLLNPLFRWLERRTVRAAKFVISVSEVMRRELRHCHPLQPSEKFVTIYNGYDEADFEGLLPIKFEPDTWNLVYMGTASHPHHPFDGILDAIARLSSVDPMIASRLRLHMVGHMAPEYRQQVIDLNIAHLVRIYGFLPHREALRVLISGDAALLTITSPEGSGAARYDVSGKLFNYLRAGKPVLARIPRDGEADTLLRDAGLLVELGDRVEDMRGTLQRMINSSTVPAPRVDYIQRFNRRTQAGQLGWLLDQCRNHEGQRGVGADESVPRILGKSPDG